MAHVGRGLVCTHSCACLATNTKHARLLFSSSARPPGTHTPTHIYPQVALNWIICKGALPIPGAKNKGQVAEIAGAVGWRLTDAEVTELERAADKIETPLGAPFEQW